ncbi:hypothetical protein ASG49_09780 [Marmoricola sp. Leaf446]|nr:hypothetical protein ASG49_09780 [Marmoricola sp. Leaf446]
MEVRIGTRWLPGELRSWIRRGATWWAHVDYVLPGDGSHTATVMATSIRSTDPRAEPPPGSSEDGSQRQEV